MVSNRIGPQVSFTVNEGEKNWDPRLNQMDQHFLADSISSFHLYHGTGSTFIEFCASALIHNIRKKNNNITDKYIMAGLDIAMQAFIQSCDALNLSLTEENYHPVVDHFPVPTADPVTDLFDNEEISETDWFFTDDANAITKDPYDELRDALNDYKHIVPENDGCIPSAADAGSTIFSEEWVLEGLQHCLPHEWNPLISVGATSQEKSTANIALPMQLAGAVAKYLWYPTGLWKNIHTIRTASIHTQDGSIDISPIDHIDLFPSLKKHLHVYIIHGLSMHHSTTWTGKLIFGCQLSEYDLLLQCARYRNTIISTPNHSIPSAIFTNTIILQSNIGLLGTTYQEQNRDIGNSQQAREISIQHSISAEVYLNNLQRQREHGNTHSENILNNNTYIEDMCDVLQYHQIDLIIAQSGSLTGTLMDALTQYHIAVVHVATSRELDSAADLTGGSVIEDLSWLQAEDIGRQTVCVEYVLDLPVVYTPGGSSYSSSELYNENEGLYVGGMDIQSKEDVLQVGDQAGHQGLCLLSRYSIAHPPANNASDIGTFSTNTSHMNANSNVFHPAQCIQSSDYNEADQANSVLLPVSVFICAPTQAMCSTLHDRFQRCLHRLRSILQYPNHVHTSANNKNSNSSINHNFASVVPVTNTNSSGGNINHSYHSFTATAPPSINNSHGNSFKQSHHPQASNNKDIKTGLMPGAGVPEMLCFLRIEEIITALNAQQHKSNTSLDDDDGIIIQISILQLFQEILIQYILSICQNNAVPQSDAQERLYLCLQKLRSQDTVSSTTATIATVVVPLVGENASNNSNISITNSKIASSMNSYSNILTTVQNMSNTDKLYHILAPIHLSDVYEAHSLSNVLDSVYIRITSIQTLIMTVKQMYYTIQL